MEGRVTEFLDVVWGKETGGRHGARCAAKRSRWTSSWHLAELGAIFRNCDRGNPRRRASIARSSPSLSVSFLFAYGPVTAPNYKMTAFRDTDTAEMLGRTLSIIADKGYRGRGFVARSGSWRAVAPLFFNELPRIVRLRPQRVLSGCAPGLPHPVFKADFFAFACT